MELGVSRRHGKLHFDNGRLYYTDLKSSNGSRVNGASLYSEIPVALDDGDEICLGKIAFRVYFGPYCWSQSGSHAPFTTDIPLLGMSTTSTKPYDPGWRSRCYRVHATLARHAWLSARVRCQRVEPE